MGQNKEDYSSLRWLYDDEQSYQKAVRKMRLDALLEQKRQSAAKRAKPRAIRFVQMWHASIWPVAQRMRALPRRTQYMAGALLAAVVVIPAVSVWQPWADPASSGTSVKGAKVEQNPDFTTLLPGGDSSMLRGKIVYDEGRRVASFSDSIGSDPIVVSQQPLPERFKASPATELEKFAQSINAKDKLEIGEITAFSGVSAKGPQTIVFTHRDLLVFMTSERKLQNKAWFDYIASLR